MKNILLRLFIFIIFAATLFANNDFISSAQNGNIKKVQEFISSGINVNTKNNHGNTALIAAASEGYTEIVECLINAKADINTKNKDGQTALMLASDNGHYEIVVLLRSLGAK